MKDEKSILIERLLNEKKITFQEAVVLSMVTVVWLGKPIEDKAGTAYQEG
jgi:hypothetical protein